MRHALTDKVMKRFWSRVDIKTPDECWPWKGKSFSIHGYGLFSLTLEKGKGRNHVTSRIACCEAYGNPTKEFPFALHSCDNPPCCNPKHLRWGNYLHNRQDSKERNRDSKPPLNYPGRHTGKMPKGENLHNGTMNEGQVREIWRLHLTGQYNSFQIAKITEAKQTAVCDVCRGRGWRHLENAPTIEELKAGGVRRGYNQFS